MVKRSTLAFLFLLLTVSLVLAQVSEQSKVETYLNGLKVKLAAAQKAKETKRIRTLQQLIDEATVRLEKIKVAAAQPVVVADDNDQVADLKEETNKALASLKNDLEKVKADNKDAKVNGVIFFRWQKYTQNGGTNVNNFDVDRAYIDIKKKLDWNASSRLTLDVARITGSPRQNLFDYLKYAYVEMPLNVAALQVVPWELTAKIGLQHTPWIDWADKQLNLRYIAKSLLDNEGVMTSSDFGVGALGKIAVAGLPEIEYHGTVLNGTGYATNESDSKKAIAARFNSTVFSDENAGKVIVGLFGNIESVKSDFSYNGSMKQGGLAVSYQHDLAKAYLEYVTGSKSSKKVGGYSLGTVLHLGNLVELLKGYNLFARVDSYDPDTAASNNEKNKSFYGVTYDWGKDVKLALDMQNSQTGSGTTTSILYAHSSITF